MKQKYGNETCMVLLFLLAQFLHLRSSQIASSKEENVFMCFPNNVFLNLHQNVLSISIRRLFLIKLKSLGTRICF